jgi:hypothetical protein
VGDASGRPDPPSTWAEGAFGVTRRPDTLVSLNGHPERRDLIGARLRRDSSQYRRVSPAPRVESERYIERSLGREDDRRRKTGHLGRGDLGCGHAPRLPRSGGFGSSRQRSLGESSVPTTELRTDSPPKSTDVCAPSRRCRPAAVSASAAGNPSAPRLSSAPAGPARLSGQACRP